MWREIFMNHYRKVILPNKCLISLLLKEKLFLEFWSLDQLWWTLERVLHVHDYLNVKKFKSKSQKYARLVDQNRGEKSWLISENLLRTCLNFYGLFRTGHNESEYELYMDRNERESSFQINWNHFNSYFLERVIT